MRNARPAASPCLAAQYVRMSAEHQRYSVENQKAAIAAYAAAHGYDVVRTYADIGKSGLSLKGRSGLRQLLADVLDPARNFDAILVLDVSRWGRFQDTDQAAHYEFLCRQAKVRIVYCQEAFSDDVTPSASIMKLLKRVMAAEYLKELSAKVSRGQLRLAARGYFVGGGMPYGFRRELRDEQGRPRLVLEAGQRKAVQSERVVLVPGPPDEIAAINRIFARYATEGMSLAAIARSLIAEGATAGGRRWSTQTVRNVLANPLCAGLSIYNRTTRKLQTKPRKNPESDWVRVSIMAPVVPPALFAQAQARLAATRPYRHDDKALLDGLRKLLQQKGRLTESLIAASKMTAPLSTYKYHFGSILNAYALIGYDQPGWVRDGYKRQPPTDAELLDRLRALHARTGSVTDRTINEDPELPAPNTIRERFGTLDQARAAAGLPVPSHAEKILRRKCAEKAGHAPSCVDPDHKAALAITPTEFLDGLKRLLAQHGYLSTTLIRKDTTLPTPAVLVGAFGSLTRAYALAGWQRDRPRPVRMARTRAGVGGGANAAAPPMAGI